MEIRRNEDGSISFYDDEGNKEDNPYTKSFSEYTSEEYNRYMLNRQHPMCRCSIIPQGMMFLPDVTKKLVDQYIAECRKSLIWIN